MDDIKVFEEKIEKNWTHWYKNKNIQRRYSAVLIIKSRKRRTAEGIELPS